MYLFHQNCNSGDPGSNPTSAKIHLFHHLWRSMSGYMDGYVRNGDSERIPGGDDIGGPVQLVINCVRRVIISQSSVEQKNNPLRTSNK